MAMARGSLDGWACPARVFASVLGWRKKTSGLVQAATARRMWVVRKDRPTWYAAAWNGCPKSIHTSVILRNKGIYESDLTVHPAETFSRDHLEVNALVAVLGVHQM